VTLTVTPTATNTPLIPTLTSTPTGTTTPTMTSTPVTQIQVYPNPFRPKQAFNGTLKFTGLVPSDHIRIFTVAGVKVIEKTGVSFRWDWDGKNSQGSDVVSGLYIWVVQRADGEKVIGKLIILR
jgi:hypothetical protein